VTKLLLEHGADPNSQENIHERPLLAAAFAGNDEIVDRFIKKGADVDVPGGLYGTALQAAVFQGHDNIVQLLLKNGADPNRITGFRGSAIEVASANGHTHIVDLLKKGGTTFPNSGAQRRLSLQASDVGAKQILERVEINIVRGSLIGVQRKVDLFLRLLGQAIVKRNKRY